MIIFHFVNILLFHTFYGLDMLRGDLVTSTLKIKTNISVYYNSIAVNLAVWHSENFRDKKVIRIGSAVLMVSIILSTMFLKQHSVFDVVTGIIMAVFMYMLVYVQNPARMTAGERKYERKLHQI